MTGRSEVRLGSDGASVASGVRSQTPERDQRKSVTSAPTPLPKLCHSRLTQMSHFRLTPTLLAGGNTGSTMDADLGDIHGLDLVGWLDREKIGVTAVPQDPVRRSAAPGRCSFGLSSASDVAPAETHTGTFPHRWADQVAAVMERIG